MLCRQETSATARQQRGAIELLVPSNVDSSVLSEEGREEWVSGIFRLWSHGGGVGRRVTEVIFDGQRRWWCGGGEEEEGVGRR